jgi:hypothetical protein
LTGRNPAQRFRSPDGEQNRKIFLTFFNCAPPIRQRRTIKETKIFLFCLPADAGIEETLSHPQTERAGKNSLVGMTLTPPFLFACPLGLRPNFF